jgi:hypothetical protein
VFWTQKLPNSPLKKTKRKEKEKERKKEKI